jgi:cytoskeleton protein RodZ
MTKAGFGEHLKREREMRGVSLDEICAATRISTRFLEALENEEWERLPGGIFNRGFVRAVARFLGLDEEGFVAEYALALNETAPAPTWQNQNIKPQATNIDWRPWAGLGVVLIVLLGAGWFGWHWHAVRKAQRAAAQHAAEAAQAPPPAPAPVIVPSSPPAGDASVSAAAPSASDSSAGDDDSDSAAIPANGLLLKIEAGKATTVRVSADGKRVFDGRIIAGQNRSFIAQTNFDVSAKDAGALLLELNGRTLAPIGPPGRPGKVTLTRHDASTPSGGF